MKSQKFEKSSLAAIVAFEGHVNARNNIVCPAVSSLPGDLPALLLTVALPSREQNWIRRAKNQAEFGRHYRRRLSREISLLGNIIAISTTLFSSGYQAIQRCGQTCSCEGSEVSFWLFICKIISHCDQKRSSCWTKTFTKV